MTDFVTAIKSTIDKHGVMVATALQLPFLDLDDTLSVGAIFESDSPAVLWQLLFLDEDPVDPMYKLAFSIGAKTYQDPGNYELLRIVDAYRQVFVQNDSLEIKDYSYTVDLENPVIPPALGYMYITGVDLEAQQTEQQTGLRMATVTARVVRY